MLPDFADVYSDFFEISRYLSPIPWDADVVRAYARRSLPLELSHGNAFTLAVMQTLKRLLGEDTSKLIDEWAEGRAAQIREPLEQQYVEAETELENLLREKAERERLTALRRVSYTALATTMVALPLGLFFGNSGLSISNAVFVGGLVISLFVTVYFWRLSTMRDGFVARRIADARFSRQIAILEERLGRLEVLRKADLQTLVRGRQSSS